MHLRIHNRDKHESMILNNSEHVNIPGRVQSNKNRVNCLPNMQEGEGRRSGERRDNHNLHRGRARYCSFRT
ncbi:hypothetical protein EUGRSUZ_A00358 [Eucalyptus grandis]|uniref:Uncharacterized protein n=2 Tax=Eucalyptus grandis TaxID=71139 RepID=A0ACC3LZG3_EUCGR|nr:hypothetical protein EUGRSUZ_A00358 [Eucalyptus grandis]